MINVHLLDKEQLLAGDESLIERWQATPGSTVWIDIAGESNEAEQQWLEKLGAHLLAIQDFQRPRHPPKVEHFANNSFILYRHLVGPNDDMATDAYTLAFFVSENCLISVHKQTIDAIDAVTGNARLAQIMQCPAELMCAITRHSVNGYIENILRVEETLTDLEEAMTSHGSDSLLNRVTFYRTRLRKLKRFFAYHEKLFANLLKEPELLPAHSKVIHHSLQDVYDKFERLLSLTSLCGDLSDAYLSLASHRLNKTMQVLTVVMAIFVPLTFIAGIYGMNFEHMPELQWHYSYFFTLGFMLFIALGMLGFFKYKKWL